MEDRDELQRQARSRARAIAERIQEESDNKLGDALAGAQALDQLQVMLEAVANGLRVFADGELKPEKAVLISDRQDMSAIMRITRKGRVMSAIMDGEPRAFSTTDNIDEMFDDVVAYLTKRARRPGN